MSCGRGAGDRKTGPKILVVKALLLENIHPEAERLLAERGIEVETRSGALDPDELVAALDGVQLLGIRSKTQVTAEVFERASDLIGVGAFCIGTNQIDLPAAAASGVAVFNAPFSNTRSVVELAVAEIISMARRLTEKNDNMHAGVWSKSASGSHEVRGRTLGIVGYGNIGSQLSVLAESLGMRVLFYDVADKLALGNARRCETLEELLAESETVTLHVDGRSGNAGMFGAEQFAQMRPRSLFLNLCRGFVVDHDSLREHLESGHIAGAAVDVWPVEPKKTGDPFLTPLADMDNMVLTPHIGGSTLEAQESIGHFVTQRLEDYWTKGATSLSVNFPQLALGDCAGAARIIHLHANLPGVLADMNNVLGDANINISAQSLGTQGSLGYVVTDVSQVPDDATMDAIAAIEGTIRTRVIR